MLFTSLGFLLFLPIVLLLYFICPKRIRYIWLLIASLYFYMYIDPIYIFLIIVPTIITYLGAIFIEDNKEKISDNKTVIKLCVIVNLLILGVFKYSNFFIDTINYILEAFKKSGISNVDIFLPIGISFYTFQTIGYIVDVYRGDVKAERNILKYSLFVTFFPQLVAGPIERSKSLLKQINSIHKVKALDTNRIMTGVISIAYGYFMKLVIADRASIFVDNIFGEYYLYGTVELCFAAVLFAFQIYADFSGYTLIAIGIAKVIGIDLMQNFDSPYLAVSVKDFWTRWHISLSTWFRDYLYIPLGGNRKGKRRTIVNKMIVFTLSGLWHGANWSFVIWGMLHGFGQVMEDTVGKAIDKKILTKHVNKEVFSWRLLKIVCTFVFVTFAWIFFRAPGASVAFDYIRVLFTRVDMWRLFDGSLYSHGLNIVEMNILTLSLLFVFFIDYVRYSKKKTIDTFVMEQNMYFRFLVPVALLVAVVLFGKYGSGFDGKSFIYFQF